jgi:hypothetical protein
MFTAYILAFLLANTHRPAVELEPWADAMADVCQSKVECTRLAALAVLESRFAPWVVDGSCNDTAWRQAHQMQKVCDGGKAQGAWQMQDVPFAGAGAARQASAALFLMRSHPGQWATQRAAWKLADGWMAGHP